jgi:hypothetical protein
VSAVADRDRGVALLRDVAAALRTDEGAGLAREIRGLLERAGEQADGDSYGARLVARTAARATARKKVRQ